MAANVEANSLSGISQLAANPPRYPRNPTEQVRKPLTLYISRVPGSKDIILTALKPRLKTVTAEDVSNSLYYLHFRTADDARFLEDEEATASERMTSSHLRHHSVARKALPEMTRVSFSKEGDDGTVQHTTEQGPAARATEDSGARPSMDITRPWSSSLTNRNSIRRKPLGPRSLVQDFAVLGKPLREEPASWTDPACSMDSSYPDDVLSLPTRPGSQTMPKLDASQLEGEQAGVPESARFVISLIRRDPAAGTQANVGTVSANTETRRKPAAGRRPAPNMSKDYPIITIHLTSPGYNQFRPPQMIRHTVSTRSDIERPSEDHGIQHYETQLGFHREVSMEGRGFWSRQTKFHRRAQSYDSGRDSSTSSRDLGSTSAGTISHALPSDVSDPRESEPRGYAFTSPWGGRCKFSTAGGGRTLRCRHKLPAAISAGNTTDSDGLSPALIFSELRFNLPSVSTFKALSVADSATSQFGTKVFGHIRDKISSQRPAQVLPPLPPRLQQPSSSVDDSNVEVEAPPLPPRPLRSPFVTESSSEDDLWGYSQDELNYTPRGHDTHLDLRLGQEKAGGGRKGKRAKLGKLIIYDEGFKMLDLVVAANMGIWWASWESQQC